MFEWETNEGVGGSIYGGWVVKREKRASGQFFPFFVVVCSRFPIFFSTYLVVGLCLWSAWCLMSRRYSSFFCLRGSSFGVFKGGGGRSCSMGAIGINISGLAAVTLKAVIGKAVAMRKSLHLSKVVRKGISYEKGIIVNPRKEVGKGIAYANTILRKVLRKSVRITRSLVVGSKYAVGNSICAYGLRVRSGTEFGNAYGAARGSALIADRIIGPRAISARG